MYQVVPISLLRLEYYFRNLYICVILVSRLSINIIHNGSASLLIGKQHSEDVCDRETQHPVQSITEISAAGTICALFINIIT